MSFCFFASLHSWYTLNLDTLLKRLNYSPPGRVWLVTSRLGTGKSLTFFYCVVVSIQTALTFGYMLTVITGSSGWFVPDSDYSPRLGPSSRSSFWPVSSFQILIIAGLFKILTIVYGLFPDFDKRAFPRLQYALVSLSKLRLIGLLQILTGFQFWLVGSIQIRASWINLDPG